MQAASTRITSARKTQPHGPLRGGAPDLTAVSVVTTIEVVSARGERRYPTGAAARLLNMEARVRSSSMADADEVLVIRALRGDRTGFDALVRRYRAAATVTAQRMLATREDVEDVVQEAFVRAFCALPRLRDPRRFAAWLHRIVRNLAHRRRRQSDAQVDGRRLAAAHHLPAPDPPPDVVAERREETGALYRSIACLPEEYALPLVLYYFRGMRLRHIARFLGISLPLVKWRLHRGRCLLRELLGQRDIDGGRNDDGS